VIAIHIQDCSVKMPRRDKLPCNCCPVMEFHASVIWIDNLMVGKFCLNFHRNFSINWQTCQICSRWLHFRWFDHNLVENATSISINSWTLCPISLCSFCERKTRKPLVGSCKKHTDHAIKFDHWVPMNSEKFLRKMDSKNSRKIDWVYEGPIAIWRNS